MTETSANLPQWTAGLPDVVYWDDPEEEYRARRGTRWLPRFNKNCERWPAVELADSYIFPGNTPEDVATAQTLYQALIDEGDVEAMCWYAEQITQDAGLPYEYQTARDVLERALKLAPRSTFTDRVLHLFRFSTEAVSRDLLVAEIKAAMMKLEKNRPFMEAKLKHKEENREATRRRVFKAELEHIEVLHSLHRKYGPISRRYRFEEEREIIGHAELAGTPGLSDPIALIWLARGHTHDDLIVNSPRAVKGYLERLREIAPDQAGAISVIIENIEHGYAAKTEETDH